MAPESSAFMDVGSIGIEQALKKSEARFRMVVEASPGAMVMTHAGQIEMVNAQAERVFGYRREELLGQPVEMLLPERFRGHHPALRGVFFGDPRSRPVGAGPELFGLRKDGVEFPVEIGLNPIETEDGPMVLYAIVDISERKRTAERFRLVVEASPTAMVMVRVSGQIEMVNAQAERVFGYLREELLGQPVEILLPERLRARSPTLRGLLFGDPGSSPIGSDPGLFGLRKDGGEFPIEIGVNPLQTDDGAMILYAIVDMSERKRTAERFHLLVEASPSAMVMTAATGRIEMINAQAEREFGYPREEMLGQPIEMLLPERFRGRHPALQGVFFGDPRSRPVGAGTELFCLRKNGAEFPVEIGLNPIDTEDGPMVLYAIVDISERKRTAERFRLVVEASPSAMVMVRVSGQIEMVNAQAERVFGYLREELLGQPVEMLLPERLRGHHPALQGVFFGDPRSRPIGSGPELFGLRKDGTEFPVEIGLNPFETEDGPMVLYAIVDISERTRTAQALAQSEAEFRASFEGAAVGKVLAEPATGRITRANRAFARMLGYEPDDLVGRTCPQFTWHEDLALDAADYSRLLSGENDASVREIRYVRRDGSPFWVRASTTIARASAGSNQAIVVRAIEDIDTRYKAEAALREAKQELEQVVEERTHALGQRDLLLREVYHRVKNNLQLVDSLLMMQGRKLDDPRAKQALLSLRGRIFALGLVHQQLMGSADLKTFDVVPFLDDLSKNILEGVGTAGVSISVEACALVVGLDFAVPLGLLVTELVTNSLKHAFPDGTGNISVILRNDIDAKLVLIVADDGIGPPDSATAGPPEAGLGTRIINNLVSQLEGTIMIRNQNGMTTEIRVDMPIQP